MKLFHRMIAAAGAFAFVAVLAVAPAAAAGKGDTFENDLQKLIFNGTAISGLANNASSSPITDLYVSLHSDDPEDDGDQTTNECGYTSYDRVAVSRDGTGWVVTDNSVSPANDIDFPAATGSSCTVTHFCIGTDDFPATGKLLYCGTVTPNLAISTGITPRLTTGTTVTED